MMGPQVGYNINTTNAVGLRPKFRPQYRRHSLAPETLLPQRATPSIAINGSRVQTAAMAYAPPTRALPTMATTTVVARQYFYNNNNNNRRFSSSASLQNATSNGAGNGTMPITPGTTHIVAIDSKIEQAMDLVKTHLMFAVREEVELLRTKILELESAVIHLEAENSILREHVPNDVLQSLQPNGNDLISNANAIISSSSSNNPIGSIQHQHQQQQQQQHQQQGMMA